MSNPLDQKFVEHISSHPECGCATQDHIQRLAAEVLELRTLKGLIDTQAETIKEYQKSAQSVAACQETAAQYARNAAWYRGLLEEIGNMPLFHARAHRQDDGGVVPDVLIAAVTDAVKEGVNSLAEKTDNANKQAREYKDERDIARQKYSTSAGQCSQTMGRVLELEKKNNELTEQLERQRAVLTRPFLVITNDALAGDNFSNRGTVEVVQDPKDRLDEMEKSWGNACKTVAEMHAAAVGEITGPIRGVVENVADLKSRYEFNRVTLERLQAILKWLNTGYNYYGLNDWLTEQPPGESDLIELVEEILLNPGGGLANMVSRRTTNYPKRS